MSQQVVRYGSVPEFGDDVKLIKENPGSSWTYQLRNLVANTDNQFIAVGFLFLVMLSIVPVWNAVSLLSDANYVFWEGRHMPFLIIFVFVGIAALYIATSLLFFFRARQQARTDQSIMMLATIFITLIGLVEMAVSLPMHRQVERTYTNLLHRCAESEQTHRLYEYSEVLQNIRQTPACKNKYSVSECNGYSDASPYTNYLKVAENTLKCAGFCYQGKNATTAKKTAAKLLDIGQRHADDGFVAAGGMQALGTTHPPTLFSDFDYKSSCESMIARDLHNLAGDIASQYFWTGLYLIAIVVVAGFLKLLGMCMRKKR